MDIETPARRKPSRTGAAQGISQGPAAKTIVAKTEKKIAKTTESQAQPERAPRREPQRLSSVAMAMRLLKTFSEGEAEIGVTSLAKKLGAAKSTVYRLATTLVAEGMLEQNRENEKYRLGIALFGLGALVRQRMNLSNEARPHIFALREATNETVRLALLDGHEIMYIYDLESTQAIRTRANLGDRKPAFCSAEGRIMLAFQEPSVQQRILARGLKARTPKTDIDPAHVRTALVQARHNGYAIEDEQCEIGMISLAAPIHDAEGQVVASVGIAGPRQRLDDAAIKAFAPLVVQTAAVISSRLGYKSLAGFQV